MNQTMFVTLFILNLNRSLRKRKRRGAARLAMLKTTAVAMGGLPAEGKFYLSINFEQMERFVLFADFLIFTDVRSR